MGAGGDEFYWRIECPLLLFSRSAPLTKEFVCYKEAGEPDTIWKVTLQRSQNSNSYLGLWLTSNITVDSYQESIARCLPRYQAVILSPLGYDITSMSDIWLPLFDEGEIRGNEEFVSMGAVSKALQETEKGGFITLRFQLQYRNRVGKSYPLRCSTSINRTELRYIFLGSEFVAQRYLWNRSNIINANQHEGSLSLDKLVPAHVYAATMKSIRQKGGNIEQINDVFLYFLEGPCEGRILQLSKPILIYLICVFHSLEIPIYTDIIASELISRCSSLSELLRLGHVLEQGIPNFDLLFWSRMSIIAESKKDCQIIRRMITTELEKFMHRDHHSHSVLQRRLLSTFQKSISSSLVYHLPRGGSVGHVARVAASECGQNAGAA